MRFTRYGRRASPAIRRRNLEMIEHYKVSKSLVVTARHFGVSQETVRVAVKKLAPQAMNPRGKNNNRKQTT